MKLIARLHSLVIRNFSNFNEEGQSTAEYSLVIIGAATIAGLLIAWASGSGSIGHLFDTIINKVLGRAN